MSSSIESHTSPISSTRLSTITSSLHRSSDDNNIVKLKLKKPKSWNWELSTSKSSPHIDFPRILLYDSKNRLLADVEEADCIINGSNETNISRSESNNNSVCRSLENSGRGRQKCGSANTLKSSSSFSIPKNGRVTFNVDNDSLVNTASGSIKNARKCKRSMSTNSNDVKEFLGDFVSQLKSKGYECKVRRKSSSDRNINRNLGQNGIIHANANGNKEEYRKFEVASSLKAQPPPSPPPPEQPIFIYSGKGLVQRDFNAKEFNDIRNREKLYRRSTTCNLDEIKRNESIKRKAIEINDNDKPINSSTNNHKINCQQENDLNNIYRNNFGIQKSKSALIVPNTIQPKERRKTRRAKSVNSVGFSTSILERFSAFKQRSSSTDSQCIEDTRHFLQHMETKAAPKYRLQTSAAGTLVVCEESFRNRKVRRRPRSCNKINEIDENVCPFNQKKIIRKFEYSGNANDCTGQSKYGSTNCLDEMTYRKSMMPKISPTYSTADKFPSRYEKAIANIDNLITNVILSHTDADCNHPFSMVEENMVINQKTNNDNDNKVHSIENSKKLTMIPQRIVQFKDDDNSNNRKSNKNSISTLIKSKNNNQFENDCNVIIVGSDECNDAIGSIERDPIVSEHNNSSKQKKNKCHNRKVSFNQNNNNENSVDNNDNVMENRKIRNNSNENLSEKLKYVKKTNRRKIRRSASTGSFRLNHFSTPSSSSDNEDGINANIRKKILHRRKPRCVARTGSNTSSHQSGDQTVALKNSISLSHLDSSTTNVINDASDQQVLLKLVKRLASLQHQQTNNNDKCELSNNNNNNNGNSKNQIIEDLINNIQTNDNETTNGITSSTVERNSLDKVVDTSNQKNHNNNNNNWRINNNILHNNYYQRVYQDASDKTDYITSTITSYRNKNNSNNHNNEVKENKQQTNNMGSNVSRHSGKGLSGRRTQSSGNLCNENHDTTNGSYNTPNNIRKIENGNENEQTNNNNNHHRLDETTIEICPLSTDTLQLMGVSRKDRNKFCGSLPNHLDADDVCEENLHIDNSNKLNDGMVYVTIEPKNQPMYQHHPHRYHGHEQQPNQFPPREPSPYNNSSSEKESTSSSINLGNTFRTNHDNKADLKLKLPINRSNFDIGCDQGYGSERSPEDELPPPIPILSIPYQASNHQPQWDYDKHNGYEFGFITQDCCFVVQVPKGPRGLGLSVSGGIDTNAAFPGLIRIKRLFPNQSAWCTGMLQPGDILLEANGTSLTGLTNHEALEVLRTAPNFVTLTVCRPRDEQYRKLSPPTEPPKPPQRSQPNSLPLEPLSPIQTFFSGEFEIIMVKQQGSLGFTLRKEDESVLGHYVRALVREPATTDGRIKPGDKIVAVNDVPLCPLTHEEAVIFLRQAADRVKLRLYRDDAQTPIASMSPSHSENKTISNTLKQKACLRPEAMNLLIDLAYKNRKQNRDSDSTGSSVKSNSTSPRRLRRGNNKHNSSNTSNISQNENEKTDLKSFNYPNQKYIVTTQPSSVGSDSETSTISQCSFVVQPNNSDAGNWNSTFTVQGQQQLQQQQTDQDSEYYNEDELWKMMDVDECDYSGNPLDKSDRPSYLDLAGNSGSTPIVSRKPRFQFSVAANSYELNNLDNEALDAPVYNAIPGVVSNQHQYQDDSTQDFTSLPCETFLVACRTESDLRSDGNSFRHKNPMYQSAHVQLPSAMENNDGEHGIKTEGTKNLLKWKGVMFGADDDDKTTTETATTSSEPDTSCDTAIANNPAPATEKDFDINEIATDEEGHKIIAVELNRGWNSRLGFSLQNNPNTKQTFISAIYSDSVAAKDGRLKVGDQILMVNDESVENIATTDIIDLLRIIRGSIVVTVRRKPN